MTDRDSLLRIGTSVCVVFRSAKERPFAERKTTIATVVSASVLTLRFSHPCLRGGLVWANFSLVADDFRSLILSE